MENWTEEQRAAVDNWFDEADADESHPVHDPCKDNWRYARKSNAEEVAAYEEARDTGCCGFCDDEIECNGETLMVGFNYGH